MANPFLEGVGDAVLSMVLGSPQIFNERQANRARGRAFEGAARTAREKIDPSFAQAENPFEQEIGPAGEGLQGDQLTRFQQLGPRERALAALEDPNLLSSFKSAEEFDQFFGVPQQIAVGNRVIETGGPVPKVVLDAPPTYGKAYNIIDKQSGEEFAVTPEQAHEMLTANPRQYEVKERPPSGVNVDIGGINLTTATEGKVQQGLISDGDVLANIGDIEKSFNQEFLTWGGALKQYAFTQMDTIDPSALTDEQRDYVVRASTFFQDAARNLNGTIKAITGAQMSEAEANRIRLEVADALHDSPTVFMAKLLNAKRAIRLSIARKRMLLRQGLSDEAVARLVRGEPVEGQTGIGTLDQVAERLLPMRTKKKRELIAGGMAPAEAAARADQEVLAPYGVTLPDLLGEATVAGRTLKYGGMALQADEE